MLRSIPTNGGHDTLPAVRAGIVLFEPSPNTFTMEPMAARQDSDFVTDFNVVHAHGAFGFAVAAHHAFVGWPFGKFADGFGGGRARSP